MEATNDESPAAARVSALKLLGTEAGMFETTTRVEHHEGHAEVTEGELRAELEVMLGAVPDDDPRDITDLVDGTQPEAESLQDDEHLTSPVVMSAESN